MPKLAHFGNHFDMPIFGIKTKLAETAIPFYRVTNPKRTNDGIGNKLRRERCTIGMGMNEI